MQWLATLHYLHGFRIHWSCSISDELRSIIPACMQAGSITFDGKTPEQQGIPKWRAHVTYLAQSRVAQKGTPAEFYEQVKNFEAQRGRPKGDLPRLVNAVGLEQMVLTQQWSELSVSGLYVSICNVCGTIWSNRPVHCTLFMSSTCVQ